MKRIAAVWVLICAVGLAQGTFGQVPQLINFQGRLLSGTNLVQGNVGLSLRLFNSSGGGSLLYEDSNSVTVVDGLYSTFIGDDTTSGSLADALTNAPLWLEVAVNGIALSPRERVAAVAYALMAGGVTNGAITTAMLGNSAVTGAKIADGTISNADLAACAVTGDKIASGTISNVNITAGTIAADRIVTGTFVLRSGDTMTGALTNQQGITAPRYFCSYNTVLGTNAVAIGGSGNTISLGAMQAVVAGGYNNSASNTYAAVAGGRFNTAAGDSSSVGGGMSNRATKDYATVAGGANNGATGNKATVGGGDHNGAYGDQATVAGGGQNHAWDAYGTVAGGYQNEALGPGAAVGGGGWDGTSAAGNRADGPASVVGGGWYNLAGSNYATVAGGYSNRATGFGAFVGGGGHDGYFYPGGNTASGPASMIGGGMNNVAAGEYAAIGGGFFNTVVESGEFGTIGGGMGNQSGYGSTVAGGLGNVATGWYSTVSGGDGNNAGGGVSTVPGGKDNVAAGSYSFAAGRQAKALHEGAFVWADSPVYGFDFTSTANNQFLIRASGGVGIGTANPSSALHVKNTDDDGGTIRIGANATTLVEKKIRFGDGDYVTIGESGAADDLMLITASKVGISRVASTYKLEVEGDAAKTAGGNTWSTISDRRVKTDIQDIADPLAMVARLHPVKFRYTDEFVREHPATGSRPYYNFIAQEFQDVFPDDVKEDPSTGYLQVNPWSVVPCLVASVQELTHMANDLSKENAGLKQELIALRARLDALEKGR